MPKVQQGGILDIAQPIPISRVMVVCSHCERPTRVGHAVLDSGKRVRDLQPLRRAAGGAKP